MSLINCPECSKEISDKALSCPNCGYPLSIYQNSANFYIKKKLPGRGLGIAGMILGIFGVVYSPIIFMSIFRMGTNVIIKQDINIMGVYVAIFGILALSFGFVSRGKGYKHGQSAAAVIMGFITVIFCIAIIIASAFA